MTRAGVLLAAGASRRFGPADKLLADLHGKPLLLHAAAALRALSPDILIAVTRSDAVADLLSDFEIARPSMPDPAQGDSLKAGVALAQERGAGQVVITLGDMPFVTPDLIGAVVARASDTSPSATTDGTTLLPPACFPAAMFPQLLALSGDRGAGSLLRDLPEHARVRAPADILQDVDTPDRLAALNARA